MDKLSQRQIREAAEKFADVYREALEGGASALQLQTELTWLFLDRVLYNLSAQARFNHQHFQESWAELSRVPWKVFNELSQQSANAYVEFLDALNTYGQEVVETSERTSFKEPRPRLPLFSGDDPTLARRFDEELYGFGKWR
jgi:hypothetical protein